MSSHSSITPAEAVSPELVLVDPELAERERTRLPVQALYVPAPLVSSGALEAERDLISEARALATVAAADDRGALEKGRAWRLQLGIAAAVVVALLLLDVHVEVGRNPASAESTPSAVRPPAAPSQHAGVDGPAVSQERRFAWAPMPGASRYHVEFYDGETRIFVGTTEKPQITVPKTWLQAGIARSLQPGEYRWYVWPIVSGRRAARAIVQATLSIPAS